MGSHLGMNVNREPPQKWLVDTRLPTRMSKGAFSKIQTLGFADLAVSRPFPACLAQALPWRHARAQPSGRRLAGRLPTDPHQRRARRLGGRGWALGLCRFEAFSRDWCGLGAVDTRVALQKRICGPRPMEVLGSFPLFPLPVSSRRTRACAAWAPVSTRRWIRSAPSRRLGGGIWPKGRNDWIVYTRVYIYIWSRVPCCYPPPPPPPPRMVRSHPHTDPPNSHPDTPAPPSPGQANPKST